MPNFSLLFRWHLRCRGCTWGRYHNQYNTRKSSCVTARGIPSATYPVQWRIQEEILGQKGGGGASFALPSGPKFLHFHAVFGNNWLNNRLAAPSGVGTPFSLKSWICHCCLCCVLSWGEGGRWRDTPCPDLAGWGGDGAVPHSGPDTGGGGGY